MKFPKELSVQLSSILATSVCCVLYLVKEIVILPDYQMVSFLFDVLLNMPL